MPTEVIETNTYGVFEFQLLEGPTDNPIRIRLIGGGNSPESYTFGIEGVGWNIAADILHAARKDSSTTPYHLSCFISLVRQFPGSFDLLEND